MPPQREFVPLTDPRLELTQHLTPDERAELGNASLPAIGLDPGPLAFDKLLVAHSAFGAIVLDGIAMNALRIGEQTGVQLLGPGDLLVSAGEAWPEWLTNVETTAATSLRLGLLGNELMAAAFRWPRIVQGMYASIGNQLQRVTAQLVICQLPRVDERIRAMLWLLAESWGQVTPGGVRLPLTLTHETLGALVGARRPTITLALRKLTDEGSIVHQDSGWLLLEPPPTPAGARSRILPAAAASATFSRWAPGPAPAPDPTVAYAELRETVRRLRERHDEEKRRLSEQLRRVQTNRIRMRAVRERISLDAVSRRRAPPSS